jgi:hypothetical protein
MSTSQTPPSPTQTQVVTVTHPPTVNKWEVILAVVQAVISATAPIIIHILPQSQQDLATKIDTAVEGSLAVTVSTLGAVNQLQQTQQLQAAQ